MKQNHKERLLCDHIKNKSLYRAVWSAVYRIRMGIPAGKANYQAAKKYDVDITDVAHYVGQHANRAKTIKGWTRQ